MPQLSGSAEEPGEGAVPAPGPGEAAKGSLRAAQEENKPPVKPTVAGRRGEQMVPAAMQIKRFKAR